MNARLALIGAAASACLCASLGASLSAAPANAHHSFAAEFDATDNIEVTGVVTKVEWRNPHTYFYLDVEDEAGDIHNWGLEMGSPNGLARRGWRPDSLNIGDIVSVAGFRARDGSYKGNARTVVLASGQQLFAASSVENESPAGEPDADDDDASD